MNFRSISLLSLILQFSGIMLFSQHKEWFNDKDLILTGVYYYPEQWNENQWERDFKKMSELGFEFTHFAEFAWANLEPQDGIYDFEWLDKAITLAKRYDLKVVLCTSTATPPVWLSRKYPEIRIQNEDGSILDHGARQHASFSSPVYRKYALRMIEKLAERYGENETVIGWQLDNEPDVQYDFNEASLLEFRKFLKNKYQNILTLNEHWGTAFWSQRYNSFEEITFPQLNEALMNPHQILDFRRYAAFQTNSFLDQQCQTIKRYSENHWVTTNYIPKYAEGNIRGCRSLDFESYTRYMVHGNNEGVGAQGYRVGDPLRITKPNDVFRPIKGCYGVMELQPGQVNWGKINPRPLPGSIRLWLWTVFAGGADFVCTYRFRQPLSGIEQYHEGIVGADGMSLSEGGVEFKHFMDEIRLLRTHFSAKENKPSCYTERKTAILFNHENLWNIDRQKQTYLWDTDKHIDKYYSALKSFGCPVDFISEEDDFQPYPVLIAPSYQLIDDALVQKWKNYVENGGNLVLTCRTGYKDKSGRLFEMPIGSKLVDLTGVKIDLFDTLLPEHPGSVSMNNQLFDWTTWGEILSPVDSAVLVLATYSSEFYKGKATVTMYKKGKGSVTYIGVDTETGVLEKNVLEKLYKESGIPIADFPKGVIAEYRNGLGIVMNYSDKPYTFPVPENASILIGKKELKTAGVLVFSLHPVKKFHF